MNKKTEQIIIIFISMMILGFGCIFLANGYKYASIITFVIDGLLNIMALIFDFISDSGAKEDREYNTHSGSVLKNRHTTYNQSHNKAPIFNIGDISVNITFAKTSYVILIIVVAILLFNAIGLSVPLKELQVFGDSIIKDETLESALSTDEHTTDEIVSDIDTQEPKAETKEEPIILEDVATTEEIKELEPTLIIEEIKEPENVTNSKYNGSNWQIEAKEIEPNNEYAQANTINLITKYTGNLNNNKDVDYYQFSTTSKGSIYISFNHPKIDSNNRFWEVYLIDSTTGDIIISLFSTGSLSSAESYLARVPSGTYYLKINNYHYSDEYYDFIIQYEEEGSDYESEPNNSFSKAYEIDVNRRYTGNLQTDRDIDYYTFTIPAKGQAYISFEHSKIDTTNRLWEVYLFDDKNDSSIISLYSQGNNPTSYSNTARIPQGKYYIKINNYHYFNNNYNFNIHYEQENDTFETEPNNSFSNANKIYIGTKYTGNLQTDKDIDYYEFTVYGGVQSFIFEHAKLDSQNRLWEIYIVSSISDETYYKIFIKGDESYNETPIQLPDGNYYIKVNNYHYSSIDYSFIIK